MSGAGTDVAVLGTGTMGAPIAQRLLDAGFSVRAWNRTRARAQPLAAALAPRWRRVADSGHADQDVAAVSAGLSRHEGR
jgi:3-hydroxyisobutyrate dehydrogenase-like beta-hydroxyacid dehydrogenase